MDTKFEYLHMNSSMRSIAGTLDDATLIVHTCGHSMNQGF